MKARFFKAPLMNHQNGRQTWQKVYVLTEDGLLHCKYLEWMVPSQINKQVDFKTFKETDFSYGGYQHLQEINKEEAISMRLKKQSNWVSSYLRLKNVK